MHRIVSSSMFCCAAGGVAALSITSDAQAEHSGRERRERAQFANEAAATAASKLPPYSFANIWKAASVYPAGAVAAAEGAADAAPLLAPEPGLPHPQSSNAAPTAVDQSEASADSVSSDVADDSLACAVVKITVAAQEPADADGAVADSSGADNAPFVSADAAAVLKKPCRACSDAKDLFAAFARFGKSAAASTAAAHAAPEPSGRAANTGSGEQASAVAASGAAASANAGAEGGAELLYVEPGFWEGEPRMPCPPDSRALGRAGWTLLHSMAAYYPEEPSPAQQDQMRAFLAAVGEFYPCSYCAEHLREHLAAFPPDVSSAAALSEWMCQAHNAVNDRLGKRRFDCSRAFARWRDGPADGEPDCIEL